MTEKHKADPAYESARQDTLQHIIDAAPGVKVTYYTGHLAETAEVKREDKSHLKIRGIRDGAWEAYARGFALLTQRRTDTGAIDYVATRREIVHVPRIVEYGENGK